MNLNVALTWSMFFLSCIQILIQIKEGTEECNILVLFVLYIHKLGLIRPTTDNFSFIEYCVSRFYMSKFQERLNSNSNAYPVNSMLVIILVFNQVCMF